MYFILGCGQSSEMMQQETGGVEDRQSHAYLSAGRHPETRRYAKPLLAVLRTPRDRNDTLLPRALPAALRIGFGVDPASARLARQVRLAPVFVAQGEGGYCMIDPAEVMTNCWSSAVVRRGEATVASLCSAALGPDAIQLGGVLPDGVGRVAIVRGDRVVRTVPVINNVFVALLPAGNPQIGRAHV